MSAKESLPRSDSNAGRSCRGPSTRSLPQHADPVPEVAEARVHAAQRSQLALDLAEGSEVSKLAARGVPGLVRRHTLPNEPVDQQTEVEVDFAIEITFGSPGREQAAEL